MLSYKNILVLRKGKAVFCLFLIVLCFFGFTTNTKVVKDLVFSLSVRFLDTEENTLVFYKYKAFGTQNSFDKNSIDYIETEKDFLKSKDEFTVVKIRDESRVFYKRDYVIICDENVPELNVEIYIAKNIKIGAYSLPCKTTAFALQKILRILTFLIFVPCSVLLYAYIIRFLIFKKTLPSLSRTRGQNVLAFIIRVP